MPSGNKPLSEPILTQISIDLGLNELTWCVFCSPDIPPFDHLLAVYWSVNSLGPINAIWHWRSCLTRAQVMACCLTAPSHYLNQFWLLINRVNCVKYFWCRFPRNFFLMSNWWWISIDVGNSSVLNRQAISWTNVDWYMMPHGITRPQLYNGRLCFCGCLGSFLAQKLSWFYIVSMFKWFKDCLNDLN